MGCNKGTIKNWCQKTTKKNSFSSIHGNNIDASSRHTVFPCNTISKKYILHYKCHQAKFLKVIDAQNLY